MHEITIPCSKLLELLNLVKNNLIGLQRSDQLMLYWLTTSGLGEHRNLARHESVTKQPFLRDWGSVLYIIIPGMMTWPPSLKQN